MDGGGLWRRKAAQPQEQSAYRRTLGLLDLSGIGVAAIIGAGIFFLLGQEAQSTGPAVVIALVIGGVAALLAALSYSEASSVLPGNGSAYGFAFAALGSLPAFLVGWLFVNAYAIGNAGVVIGWQSFALSALDGAGLALPEILTKPPADGGIMNLPATLLVALVTLIATLPMRTSSRVNNVLVALKLAIVAFVIVAGAFFVRPGNWTPVAPAGWSSLAGSTAVLFFAYVGFDTIAAAGAEAKRPRRNLPLAIMLSIGVCTVLYVLMAAVVTGMPAAGVDDGRAPIAAAFDAAGHAWAGGVVTAGALVSLATVAYAFHMAMARILQAMAADGFMPRVFARVSKRGVPVAAALGVSLVTGTAAAFMPLAPVIDMGVLATIVIYAVVSVGTIVLRRRGQSRPDAFRVPAIIHWAALALLAAIAAFGIGPLIHLAFLAWCGLGLMLYGFWAHRSSQSSRSAEAGGDGDAVRSRSRTPTRTRADGTSAAPAPPPARSGP